MTRRPTTTERRNLLSAALTDWIDSLPPSDCHCVLAHKDQDGPPVLIDPTCPHHGDTP